MWRAYVGACGVHVACVVVCAIQRAVAGKKLDIQKVFGANERCNESMRMRTRQRDIVELACQDVRGAVEPTHVAVL
jgi:hypothetical protein